MKYNKNGKNKILEIITIYFIKYEEKDIDVLLNNVFGQMFINMFKGELFFLDDNFLKDEIIQKIFKYASKIENIIPILEKSENYVSYLKKINNNFENIFQAIAPLKSLKGVFKVDFEVSQKDNIDDFAKLHNELLKKQENKNKFIISFSPILKKYFNLYDCYNNLGGLCVLLSMTLIESKKFKNNKNIEDLKNKAISKIKDLLKQGINYKDKTPKEIVKVLLVIKDVFDDEKNFNFEFKKFILNYFIEKCKDNDEEAIKEYKDKKIFELFRNKDIHKNILLILLKNQEFDLNNDFMSLLPDELNNEEIKYCYRFIK